MRKKDILLAKLKFILISDTGNSVLIPSTSCDEYIAELVLWFAENGTSTLSATQLTDIFPNIVNFWSPSSGANPLGFLA